MTDQHGGTNFPTGLTSEELLAWAQRKLEQDRTHHAKYHRAGLPINEGKMFDSPVLVKVPGSVFHLFDGAWVFVEGGRGAGRGRGTVVAGGRRVWLLEFPDGWWAATRVDGVAWPDAGEFLSESEWLEVFAWPVAGRDSVDVARDTQKWSVRTAFVGEKS